MPRLPNATIPATSPSGRSLSVSRRKARASSRPALPTESDMSTTKTVASRSTGSTSWNPARAKTSAARSSDRTTSATRRRPDAHPPPRAEVEPDRQEQRRDEQQQRERRIERDAHQVPAVRGLPPEPRSEPAADPDQRITVVDGPLDAQADEDQQHDRDPQLVPGGRTGIDRGRAAPRCADAPGAPDGPATAPSASMAATEPGAIVDSSTSNRSTAKRTGAFGSAGGADGRRRPRHTRTDAASRWRRASVAHSRRRPRPSPTARPMHPARAAA